MRREYDFDKLQKAEPKYLRRIKAAVTMRLDPEVLAYFRGLAERSGVPYQSLINFVLRDYANHALEPSASWDKLKRKSSG